VGIIDVFRYAGTWPYGIDLIANRATNEIPDISKFVTHRIEGIENVPEAFTLARKPVDDDRYLALKPVIEM